MAVSPKPDVVAVVGASSGIGRAAAARFLADGAAVSLFARRGALLEELIREVRPGGDAVRVHTGDATVPADVQAFMSGTVERFGRLDTLVFSAGLNIPDRSLERLTTQAWHRLIAANLDAAFFCTHAALPHLRARQGGQIVYVSSVGALYADGSGAGYQAAKHGLTGLANAVRFEEQANGIRVSVIFPGVVNTPLVMQRPSPPSPEQLALALQPDDVAAAIRFVTALPPHVLVPEMEMRAVAQVQGRPGAGGL